MTTPAEPTLGTLAGGAAEELFDAALRAVLDNISDVNTDPKAARKIVIEIAFLPDEERRMGVAAIKCSTKLAGMRPVTAGVYFGRHQGRFMLVEAPRQDDMFPHPESRPRPVETTAPAGGTA